MRKKTKTNIEFGFSVQIESSIQHTIQRLESICVSCAPLMLSWILHAIYIKRLFRFLTRRQSIMFHEAAWRYWSELGNGTDWVLCTLFHYFSPPLAGVYCASQIAKLCWLLNFFDLKKKKTFFYRLCNRCRKGGEDDYGRRKCQRFNFE
jgi:hypothetical protein